LKECGQAIAGTAQRGNYALSYAHMESPITPTGMSLECERKSTQAHGNVVTMLSRYDFTMDLPDIQLSVGDFFPQFLTFILQSLRLALQLLEAKSQKYHVSNDNSI